MLLDERGITTFSNIRTKYIKNNFLINKQMIIKDLVVGEKKDGTPITKQVVNQEFWEKTSKKYGAVNVVIDEAHTVMSSRRSMSKQNILISEWLSMIRRVVGSTGSEHGTLTLISQTDGRLDVNARIMCLEVRYHIMHFLKQCKSKKCSFYWEETNESFRPVWICPYCGSGIKSTNFSMEVWCFPNIRRYEDWKEFGMKTYFDHYIIDGIEKYFGLYNSLTWENLISDY